MKIPYVILCYVALGVQVGMGDMLSFHGGRPNFVLLAAVFISLSLPAQSRHDRSAGSGAAQDSLSQHAMGLYGISYGITALAIGGIHRAVHRQHPLAHFSLTLFAGLVAAAVLELHSVIHPGSVGLVEDAAVRGMRDPIAPLLISAVYTAGLSWGIFWLLQRIRQFIPTSSRRAWG